MAGGWPRFLFPRKGFVGNVWVFTDEGPGCPGGHRKLRPLGWLVHEEEGPCRGAGGRERLVMGPEAGAGHRVCLELQAAGPRFGSRPWAGATRVANLRTWEQGPNVCVGAPVTGVARTQPRRPGGVSCRFLSTHRHLEAGRRGSRARRGWLLGRLWGWNVPRDVPTRVRGWVPLWEAVSQCLL